MVSRGWHYVTGAITRYIIRDSLVMKTYQEAQSLRQRRRRMGRLTSPSSQPSVEGKHCPTINVRFPLRSCPTEPGKAATHGRE